MLQNFVVIFLIFLFSAAFALVFGQTPDAAVKPSVITGEVVTIDANKIVVNAKTGPIDVVITDKSVFKRVSAENPNLATASLGALSDIGVGDKLTVTGILSTDGKSIPARSVYFMTKADIAAKNAKEAEQWRTRGISGKVTAVNSQTNQITIQTSGLTGNSSFILTPKNEAKFLRYAQDSIRFDEAKGSAIGEINVGDMMRALGDKSADGTSFAAEQIITGAFRTVAGTVKSVDLEKNEVVITDLQTNKDLTILIGGASMLKKYPAEMAERLAGFQMAAAGAARPVGQGRRPGGQGQAPGVQGQIQGGVGIGGQRTGGGVDDMLERFPNITAADLKVGDMIAVSSTKSGTTDKIKAIKLLAGVEPFLRLVQASAGGQRGQGVQGGFSIPGLDGISFP